MNRSIVLYIGVVIFIVGMSGYFWQPNARAMAIAAIQQEIQICKSLNFSPSDALIMMLASYLDELQESNQYWHISWLSFDTSTTQAMISDLIDINKNMLKSYVCDMQKYMKLKLPTSNTLVCFAYDKVVRLTIALSELEKNDALSLNECIKKVERMHEITKQAIAHSKRTLHSYVYDRLSDADPKVQNERIYLMDKMHHLIALERIIYL